MHQIPKTNRVTRSTGSRASITRKEETESWQARATLRVIIVQTFLYIYIYIYILPHSPPDCNVIPYKIDIICPFIAGLLLSLVTSGIIIRDEK